MERTNTWVILYAVGIAFLLLSLWLTPGESSGRSQGRPEGTPVSRR